MAGRPTDLTPELQDRAVQLAKAGAKGAIIADVLHIAESTYRKWLKWGSDWEPKEGDECPKDRQPFRDFREAIREAQAQPVMLCEATWLKAVQGTPAKPAVRDKDGNVVEAARPAIPGDPKAAERWLRLHRPDLYREQIDVNHGIDANAGKVIDALAAYKDVIGKVLPEEDPP